MAEAQVSEVAEGVHRITRAGVNCYVVVQDDRVGLIDAGLPAMWGATLGVVNRAGFEAADIESILLTHGHFDHVGFAARVSREFGVPVWVHERDQHLAAHPYSYTPQRNRFAYPLRHPRALPIIAAMAVAGALNVKGVDRTYPFVAGDKLRFPGEPDVVFTPGHTEGHCGLYFGTKDVLVTGDALVTLDPYTAATGPRIVAAAATANTQLALDSLQALADTGAGTVLPGHGDQWTDGIASAVELARVAGSS